KSSTGVHQFQQFTDQLNRRVCSNSSAERRRHNQWNVGLHVLGRGVDLDASRLHDASEFVRRRCRSWRHHLQHSDPDAGVASKLESSRLELYPVENNGKPFTRRREEKPRLCVNLPKEKNLYVLAECSLSKQANGCAKCRRSRRSTVWRRLQRPALHHLSKNTRRRIEQLVEK